MLQRFLCRVNSLQTFFSIFSQTDAQPARQTGTFSIIFNVFHSFSFVFIVFHQIASYGKTLARSKDQAH